MIRIEAVWLATEPMDMRAGTDTALARAAASLAASTRHPLNYVAAVAESRRVHRTYVESISAATWRP